MCMYKKSILSCGAHTSPRKVCDENETRIRRREKMTGHLKEDWFIDSDALTSMA